MRVTDRLGELVSWPPPDTDRNRFVFTVGFPLGVLVAVYLMLFALVSGGWLIYVAAVLALATTLVLGIGLLLMHSRRQEVARVEAELAAREDPAPPPGQ